MEKISRYSKSGFPDSVPAIRPFEVGTLSTLLADASEPREQG